MIKIDKIAIEAMAHIEMYYVGDANKFREMKRLDWDSLFFFFLYNWITDTHYIFSISSVGHQKKETIIIIDLTIRIWNGCGQTMI